MSDGEEVHLVGLVAGFAGYYRPLAEARANAFRHGLIVLDTSALLDLYRLSPAARLEFLSVLSAVRQRIFVPHQVASEFHNRRVDAVAERTHEFESQLEQLDDLLRRTHGVVNQVARRAHGQADKASDVDETVRMAFNEATHFVRRVANEYDLDPDGLVCDPPDKIVVDLERILMGRVGGAPSDGTLIQDREEAQRRLELKLPPGFRDKHKGDSAKNDYLWWAEVVRFARATQPSAVIIVSNDVAKGDWTFEQRGFRVGPAPLLVAEIDDACGATLHWATSSEVLAEVPSAVGGAAVSEYTLREARGLPLQSTSLAAIRDVIHGSPVPVVSASVANIALKADPSLKKTSWAGTGSFRAFLSEYAPELRFIVSPLPGYVLDPNRHLEADIPPARQPAPVVDEELQLLLAEEEEI